MMINAGTSGILIVIVFLTHDGETTNTAIFKCISRHLRDVFRHGITMEVGFTGVKADCSLIAHNVQHFNEKNIMVVFRRIKDKGTVQTSIYPYIFKDPSFHTC